MPLKIKVIFFMLIVSISYLLFIEKNLLSTDKRKKIAARIINVNFQKLLSVKINNIKILHKENHYSLVTPVNFNADQSIADELFLKCANIPVFNSFSKKNNDEFYGFADPLYVIDLETVDKNFHFIIGKEASDSLGNEFYLKDSSRPEIIFTVPESFVTFLSSDYRFYVEKKPFSFLQRKKIHLDFYKNKQKEFSLIRHQSIYYILNNQGTSWQARHNLSEELVNFLASFTIPHEQRIAQSEFPIRKILSASGVEGIRRDLFYAAGKESDYIAINREGPFFPVEKSWIKNLDITFNSLTGRTVYEAPLNQLAEIVFQDRNSTVVYRGNKMNWNLVNPFNAVLAKGKILKSILSFFIQPVSLPLKGRPEGEKKGRVIIKYADKEAKPSELVFFKNKDKTYCYNSFLNCYTLLEEQNIFDDLLLMDFYKFIDSYPFSRLLDISHFLEILKNEKTTGFVKNSLGLWEKDNKFKGDLGVEILDTLSTLKCFNAAAASKGVDFGFNKPLLTFVFRNRAKEIVCALKLGSYSNEKESFFFGDESFFLFCKGLSLE